MKKPVVILAFVLSVMAIIIMPFSNNVFAFSRYDINSDGQIDINDILCIRDCIFGTLVLDGLSEEETYARCDVNGDKTVSIADILVVLQIIFHGEPETDPPAEDPTDEPPPIDMTYNPPSTDPPPTEPPPTDPPRTRIKLIEAPDHVCRNDEPTITIQGAPYTEYKISVIYASGAVSKAQGLEPKTSDENGRVSWTWRVGPTTGSGDATATISGGGQSIQHDFFVGDVVLQQAGNPKAFNHYGPCEPLNPSIGDLWFKETGDKSEMWIYETRNGVTQWYNLMTPFN